MTLFRSAIFLAMLFVAFSGFDAVAQDQTTSTPAKPAFVSPSQRLMNAKAVYVKNAGGSSIPFDVINGEFEGWGRFIVVESPEKADLIVEVTSPEDLKPSHFDRQPYFGIGHAGADDDHHSRNWQRSREDGGAGREEPHRSLGEHSAGEIGNEATVIQRQSGRGWAKADEAVP